jgi:hypothetical protein
MPQVDKVAKHTLTLPSKVYGALKVAAEKQGLEAHEVIQNLIVQHVITAGTLDDETKAELEAYRWLVDRVVDVARQRLLAGKPIESLTPDTLAECVADPEWAAKYRFYVQDDIFKNGNPRKGPINREFGFRIRAAVGAEVLKDDSGRPVLKKILGGIIQSYTPFTSFDKSKI